VRAVRALLSFRWLRHTAFIDQDKHVDKIKSRVNNPAQHVKVHKV
jgi:hypothetical protein